MPSFKLEITRTMLKTIVVLYTKSANSGLRSKLLKNCESDGERYEQNW
jgi:hypothetical protein